MGVKGVSYLTDLMLALSPQNTLELCEKLAAKDISNNNKSKETLFSRRLGFHHSFSSILKASIPGPSISFIFAECFEYIDSIPISMLEVEQSEGNEKKNNATRLETVLRILVFQSNSLKNAIPVEICWLLNQIRNQITRSFEGDEDVALQSLCSFFFLRFFCFLLSNHNEKSIISLTSPHSWHFLKFLKLPFKMKNFKVNFAL